MQSCPCCGAPLPNVRFLVDLATNSVTYKGRRVSVRPPKLAEFLYALSEKWPGTASLAYLTSSIWGVTEPRNPDICVSIYASKARKILKPMGVTIESSYARGYRLVLN